MTHSREYRVTMVEEFLNPYGTDGNYSDFAKLSRNCTKYMGHTAEKRT